MAEYTADELYTVFDKASEAHEEPIVAVAKHVEARTIEALSKPETQVNVLAEIAHQLTRLADQGNRPTPTITAEQAIGAWPLKGGMYSHLAVGYLESLGVAVEQEPTR